MLHAVQGENLTYKVNLISQDTDLPFDLTGATEIKVLHPGKDGTPVEATLTNGAISVIGDSKLGQFEVALTTSLSDDLKVGDNQTVEVQVTDSNGDLHIEQYAEVLSVKDSLA